MSRLRSGQDTVLSWGGGAVDCQVVAAAGQFVLLRPAKGADVYPFGRCSLTYLDGMVPVGFSGTVEPGGFPGEWRFRAVEGAPAPERRSSVRLPVLASATATLAGGDVVQGHVLDVSAGGMRFRHSGRIAVGTLLRVAAALPDGIAVDADAVVRASEPGVTSVEFTAMHGVDAQTLGAWAVGVLRAGLAG